MSTLRTTTLKHGSSTIDNIVFDNQGRSTFGGNALFVNAQNQRVGVNTTTPSVALDVDGAINATGNVVFSGQLNLTGNLTVDTNTLFVDATNNRVGIGTATPVRALHVSCGSSEATQCVIEGGSPELWFKDVDESSIVRQIINTNGWNIQIGTGSVSSPTWGTVTLTANISGNIGVGTNSPEAKLTINVGNSGDSTIGGRTINYGANLISTSGRTGFLVRVSNSFTLNNDNSGFQWLYPHDTGGDDDYKVFRSAVGSTLVDKFWVSQAGGGYFADEVGIGTTSTSSLLTLASDAARIDINTTADNTAQRQNSVRFKYQGVNAAEIATIRPSGGTASDTYLSIRTGGSGSANEAINVAANKDVGIGTSSPERILHVSNSGGQADCEIRIENTDGEGRQLTFLGAGSTARGIRHTGVSGGNALAFTAGSATQMTLDSSGRLLIGYTLNVSMGGFTPALQQHANSASGTGIYRWSNNGGAPILGFAKSRGTAPAVNAIVIDDDPLGSLIFSGDDGTDLNNQAASITANVDGTPAGPTPGPASMPGRLVFSTTAVGDSSPTERMRITNSGSLTVFSTNGRFQSRISAGAGTTDKLYSGAHSASSVTSSSSETFRVWSNGNVENTNNSYTAISDIKLKENIVDASSQWDDIKALRPVNYNFKEGQTHTQLGLIAQEVELVSPGLVSESPDRNEEGNDLGTTTKSVNYSVLYMKAIKALQEAMERIEVLEQRVLE